MIKKNNMIATLIGISAVIEGDFSSNASTRIDGIVKGNVTVSNDLFIGKTAVIEGNVEAVNVISAGVVNGDATVSGTIKLVGNGEVKGIITAPEEQEEVSAAEEKEEIAAPEEKEETRIPEEQEETTIPEEQEETTISEEQEEATASEAQEEIAAPEEMNKNNSTNKTKKNRKKKRNH